MPQQDARAYVRIAVDFPSNRKLAGADPRTKYLDVVAVCWSGQNTSDGEVTPAIITALAGVPTKHAKDLIDRDRWHQKGHACPDCPQPETAGNVVIHDYLKHQEPAEKVRRRRDERVLAGRKGNHTKWSHPGTFEECSTCND